MVRISSKTAQGLGRALSAALLCASLALAGPAAAEEDPWPDLRDELFGDRPIADGAGVIELEAPYRAHDAAIVPITIAAMQPQTADRYIKNITLTVDVNPAPVAAVFGLGPRNGSATISTRVRVNAYSNVRAIAEMNDGSLYMAVKFVKASGGCSAPALKDQDATLAAMGKMKLRQFTPKPGTADDPAMDAVRQVQLMIRHPQYSGFQMDPISRLFIPPHYVSDIEVKQGDQTLLTVQGAISLSEDPSIRFSYVPQGADPLSVEVRDTEDQIYSGSWDAPVASSDARS